MVRIMIDAPYFLQQTGLYKKLLTDSELHNAVLGMRAIATTLAATISNSVPCFTDHSVKHMDALWVVTDTVLTTQEIDALTHAEAFLLASSFYLHDLGMAYAATDEGRRKCIESTHYSSFIACFPESDSNNENIQAQALAFTVRKIHASAAQELAIDQIPGTQYYLFESKSFRESWGATCGQIAASHHWTIEKIDAEFGKAGVLPLPGGRNGDLGYVASILRIVDYAHINRDRAPSMERAFKRPLPADSLLHWLAQEQIDGPTRDGHELIYRSAVAISNVDSWWLYYEMLSGLDAEIRAVQRYLKRRPSSLSRFSLQGVLGAANPEETSLYIKPDEFMPIEVNLKTGSIDRLVKLLAGESLYGSDPMAAVRELLQNANDAVRLKFHTATDEWDEHVAKLPIKVDYYQENGDFFLVVSDFGVGMNARIMTDYLISIASNYWESQFHHDFPSALKHGFAHAGKFGIGFLSVFMLGDEVEVTSNRAGGERTLLKLHGVGRRGELRSAPFSSKSGTSVKIKLRNSVIDRLESIESLVKAYAPMLNTPIKTTVHGKEETLVPEWLFKLTPREFKIQINTIINDLSGSRSNQNYYPGRQKSAHLFDNIWADSPPEYVADRVRLVVSSGGNSILCLKGLSLQVIQTPGFSGIIELNHVAPDVSRRHAINVDYSDILKQASSSVMAPLAKGLELYSAKGLMLDKIDLISRAVAVYGRSILTESSIKWISNISLPGEISLCDSSRLHDLLNMHKVVFIAFDAQPWAAMKLWTRGVKSVEGEVAFTFGESGSGPGYTREIEFKVATLKELWPNYNTNTLFNFLVNSISKCWSIKTEDLVQQDDWRHEGSTIFGRFMRV